jgi:hypothetical protein
MGLQAILDLKEFRTGAQQYKQLVAETDKITADSAKKTEAAAQDMSAAWDSYWKKTDQASLKAADSVKKGADEAAKGAAKVDKSLVKMIKSAAAAVLAFMALRKAMSYLKDATLLAARVETLGVSLAVVGRNAGYSTEQLAKFEAGVKAQGITTQNARQALLMMGQAQIDFTHATDLARIAQDAAVIANTNSSDAFQRLTWAISTGSILMTRRLGLQVSFEKAYERMAIQLDKTTSELTESERVQARVNAIIYAGTQIAGTYEAAMDTAGKKMSSLVRLFEEAALAIGKVGLGAFGEGIDEITRLIKDFNEWAEESEEELGDLSNAVEMLVDQFTDLVELPTENLTDFVENLTTMASLLAVGIEQIKMWRSELEETFGVLTKIQRWIPPMWPARLAEGFGILIGKATELRKADEDLFKTQKQLAKEREEALEKNTEAEERAVQERADAAQEARDELDKQVEDEEDLLSKQAKTLTDFLNRMAEVREDYHRKLKDLETKSARRRERDLAKHTVAIEKQIRKGLKALEKITKNYYKKRDKLIADYEKRVAKAQAKTDESNKKARDNYEMEERHRRERFNLDMLQSERRYQFARANLVAEGDTLAIEQLDARYKLEQQEAKENEALRRKQAEEAHAARIEEAKEIAKIQAEAIAEELAEALAELQESYRDQMAERREADRDRLREMEQAFQEQQRLRGEDDELARQKAEEDYQRQLRDLGSNLAAQEEIQQLGAQNVERILDLYYGEGGISDLVMEGWHERENIRIATTATLLELLGQKANEAVVDMKTAEAAMESARPWTWGGMGWTGVTMDEGGVVAGPATVQVGAGIVEAFTPIARMGGAMDLSWTGDPIQVAGLEGAAPGDASEFVRSLTREITRKLKIRRRN